MKTFNDISGFPEFAEPVLIAAGVIWIRLPLPYALNHVNVYLFEDSDGWTLIDTGLGDERTQQAWEGLWAGPLRHVRLQRVIATHHHPDHMGLAGWLCERFGIPVMMTPGEAAFARRLGPGGPEMDHADYVRFYTMHGMARETADIVFSRGHEYRLRTTGVPANCQPLIAGDRLDLGERAFEIMTGGGHSPEQAMLYCASEGLLVAADQVIQRISPNISMSMSETNTDPLDDYIASLRQIRASTAHDALVLAGHHLPFRSLHQRIDELIAHHETRCEIIVRAAEDGPLTVAQVIPLMFKRELDPQQLSFAFGEALAHVAMLINQRRLEWQDIGTMRAFTLSNSGD